MSKNSFLNKDYAEMTEEELSAAHQYWIEQVQSAGGWSSAYFAAKQLKNICSVGRDRGMKLANPYPIKFT